MMENRKVDGAGCTGKSGESINKAHTIEAKQFY
jgi:hypothetical protein